MAVIVGMTESLQTHFTPAWLTALLRSRTLRVVNTFNNIEYEAQIIIPNYRDRVLEQYQDILKGNLELFTQRANIPFSFKHFGIEIAFSKPIELALHDINMAIEDCLRYLMGVVGPVVITNAYHQANLRSVGHRNRFPHLNFHVDRSANQPEHYSMYSRDPFDDEQQHPRNVSTLICANIVGYLQSIREGITDINATEGMRSTYNIFSEQNMDEVLGNTVLEQKWNAPKGIGEIAMQDNLTCLHASYYYNQTLKGYKIGVRYVA